MKEDATTFCIRPNAVKVGTQPDAWKVHHDIIIFKIHYILDSDSTGMFKFCPIALCKAIIAMNNICIPVNIPSKQFLQAHQSSSNFTKIPNSICAAQCAGAQCHLYNWVLNIMAPMLWSLTSGTNCHNHLGHWVCVIVKPLSSMTDWCSGVTK